MSEVTISWLYISTGLVIPADGWSSHIQPMKSRIRSICLQISVFQKDDKPELLISKIGCWTTTAQGFNTFILLIMINVLTCANILSCIMLCFHFTSCHMSKKANTSQVKYKLKNHWVSFAPFGPPNLCTQHSACYEHRVKCHAAGPVQFVTALLFFCL